MRAVESSFGLAHEIGDGRVVSRLDRIGGAVALQLGKKIEAPHVDGYHWKRKRYTTTPVIDT